MTDESTKDDEADRLDEIAEKHRDTEPDKYLEMSYREWADDYYAKR